ncbi:hypothetical protein SPRG_08857 [Saprolegnia parasitica CBS 223.65]|uniref:Uncharacterized protein n=1 Tax=Saprolegnia parasitica (strain CBS 223.65) TaxID=695850 RepID=A0A067CH92_SAPPC|nr:hypothetical protein SPRG_08857 [Saprolegnia parasitica CBS 223.65]KDO25916.1 hypothetical protein SPRG_08857 [Saprolegnia parasitica CBS 223.65]|eukprot:XP_012203476.1 hypothetical protein SPRG_08857 [Saprolegnia parasitica CBS 223.65]
MNSGDLSLEEVGNLEDQELLALARLDAQCTALQEAGNYTQALEVMEKGLILRQHFFGSDSDQVRAACKTVGDLCNLLAMTFLQQENFPIVLELLKKAEILTETNPAGRAVTLNNLACYHRRLGHLQKALNHLNEALAIEATLLDVPNRADTHLNMCAVLSQLGRHQGALEHAQSALILLHEELFSTNQINLDEKLDRVAVLGIAYHNVGVEQEFLKKPELSVHSYKKGADVTAQHLGETHGIVVTLRNSLLTAQRSVGRKQTKGQDGISRFAKIKNHLRTKLKRRHPSRVATDG